MIEHTETKRYRVVGGHPVDGHPPGDTYEADYSAEHEQYLITAGHIELDYTVEGDDQATDNPPGEGDYTPEEGDA